MKQVLIKGGAAIVEEVPAPTPGAKNVLVQVEHSCISAGTEMASVALSAMPLYRRALKQPENVKKVFDMARDFGVKRTLDRVMGKLSSGSATGYSAAGAVVALGGEVEGFHMGQRVACAGAGIANHAELIDVPVNLVARVPDAVPANLASTVTLGAIALQGVRRADPTLGETIVVVGLGILGQLTVQMLHAGGCRVVGVDVDQERVDVAERGGMEYGVNSVHDDYVARVVQLTDGFGADAVIITAATPSHEVIHQAAQCCRRKGRVVLVGDVGLNLRRADFYKKELDFLISTSYGPGRYDPVYEDAGLDYPLSYVRWTENRNMEAYLSLLANGGVRLDHLPAENFDIDDAADAYAALQREPVQRPLLVFLDYPPRAKAGNRTVALRHGAPVDGRVQVALVGAGGFAQGVHLPNMQKLRDDYQLRWVMSRTGANAKAIARQHGAAHATTDIEEVLSDPDVSLIMICTRHNLHADYVLRALQRGKAVFVEKPLALNRQELETITQYFRTAADAPLLMTGFNRRFSPSMSAIQRALAGRVGPMIVNYRMNAGYIAPDHWVHGPEGGGRNLGEACHIYDLFNFLTGATVSAVSAVAIQPASRHWRTDDNFVATISYADGSVCTLVYTALGSKAYPKERMDIFCEGKVISMDDYRSVEVNGGKTPGWSSRTIEKGQYQELQALASCLRRGAPWPIPLEQQAQATEISFAVQEQIVPH